MSAPQEGGASPAAGDRIGDPVEATGIPAGPGGRARAARAVRRAFVTGASGFVGANLVRTLIERGIAPVAFVRRGSGAGSLEGLPVEIIEGDLLDGALLRDRMRACDACFHLAASLSSDDPGELHRVNVEGSRAVLEAAAAAGCSAIVHGTTIGTLGRDDGGLPRETDSRLGPDASEYARSKFRSEEAALEIERRGAPVMLAHIAAPVGPWDRRPTVTGRRILRVLQGKKLVYPAGVVNHVAVRDVAMGLLLAAGLGEPGRRYLMALEGGNLDREQFVAHALRAAGRLPRRRRGILGPLGFVFRKRGGSEGPAAASLGCDPSWTVRELGLPQSPLEEAFREAVAWFRERGYW